MHFLSKKVQLGLEECRIILVHLLQDGSNQRFTNKFGTVINMIPLAEPIQCPLLGIVEQDSDLIISWRFFHQNKSDKCTPTETKQRPCGELYSFPSTTSV